MRKKLLLTIALGVVASCAAAFGVGCSKPNSTDNTPETPKHNYGEWVIDRKATCTRIGQKYHVCQDEGCNNMEWEAIPMIPHDYNVEIITASEHTLKCSGCGDTKTEAHNYKNGICTGCGVDEKENFNFTFELSSDKDYYIITSVKDKNATNIIIPSEYKDKAVKEIGDCAFQNNTLLTSITIPDSVISIGNRAFDGCSGLTSITIPDSVTAIGAYTFYNCSGLTSITIPDSVTNIGYYAFDGCSVLESIYYTGDIASWCGISGLGSLNKSKVYIGDQKLTEMTSITIPDGVTNLRDSAFNGCSALTGITIPDSVTSVGFAAFCCCSGLKTITLPHSVTSISNMAFSGCSVLESIYYTGDIASWCGIFGLWNLDNSKVYIGNQKLTEMTSIIIPDGVEFIASDAFNGCSELTSIIIPDSVTAIGIDAFNGCSKLTSIIIPDSVTSINSAFEDCTALTTIYCEAEEQPSDWIHWKGNCNATVVWGYKGEK